MVEVVFTVVATPPAAVAEPPRRMRQCKICLCRVGTLAIEGMAFEAFALFYPDLR